MTSEIFIKMLKIGFIPFPRISQKLAKFEKNFTHAYLYFIHLYLKVVIGYYCNRPKIKFPLFVLTGNAL